LSVGSLFYFNIQQFKNYTVAALVLQTEIKSFLSKNNEE